VTSATVVIYGAPIMDPVQLLSHIKQPLAVCVALAGESWWGLVGLVFGNLLGCLT